MTLLNTFKQLTAESASGGSFGAGGSAGGMAMPLFSQMVRRTKVQTNPVDDDIEQETPEEQIVHVKKTSKLREMFDKRISEADEALGTPKAGDAGFDTTGIIAKLKSLENRDKQDLRDTVTFGLEDDKEGVVRVIVRQEQAQDFEKAIQAYLYGEDQDEAPPQVAEVLYRLKDRFDIVDVQWPEVEEDEEQQVDLGDVEGDIPNEGNEIDPEMDELDAGVDPGAADATTLLTQVIDMMKADAEARTADARAREAEARTREADAIARKASTRVSQEEQLLDMETQEKARKEEEREAKRLAQLSRWKSEVDGDDLEDNDTFSRVPGAGIEDEEAAPRRPRPKQHRPDPLRGKVHPSEIAKFVLNRVK